MKYILILVFFSCLSGCSKKKCTIGKAQLVLLNFDKNESELIKVEVFEADGSFSRVKKTFYMGSSIVTESADSLPGTGFKMTLPASYKIQILNTGAVYSVENVYAKNSSVRTSPIGGGFHGCADAYSYKINNTVINIDLEIFNQTTSEAVPIMVKIDKLRVY